MMSQARRSTSTMKTTRLASLLVGFLVLLAVHDSESWAPPSSVVSFRRGANMAPIRKSSSLQQPLTIDRYFHPAVTQSRIEKSTNLFMYNLPPGGGGGGGNKNELGQVLQSVGGLVLFVGFFLSPLGGFVLSILNSFLLLAISIPVLGVVGFQVWQYFNTITGACPNCAAPVQVLKSQPNAEDTPSICFNCGAVIQANYDNTGIDNVTGKNSMMDDDSPFGSLLDIFGGSPTSPATSTRTTIVDTVIVEETETKKPSPKPNRNTNVIDVEVEDDRPFQ